jgi:hypothetical protein
MQFTNVGATSARDVSFCSKTEDAEFGRADIIKPRESVSIDVTISPSEFSDPGIGVRFKTSFGSVWEIALRMTKTGLQEEVLSVDRIYDLQEEVQA